MKVGVLLLQDSILCVCVYEEVSRGSSALRLCHCLAGGLTNLLVLFSMASVSKASLAVITSPSICSHTHTLTHSFFLCPRLESTHGHKMHAHKRAHTQIIYNGVEGRGSPALEGLFWEVQPSISQADGFLVIPGEQYRATLFIILPPAGLAPTPAWVTVTLPPARKKGLPGQQ